MQRPGALAIPATDVSERHCPLPHLDFAPTEDGGFHADMFSIPASDRFDLVPAPQALIDGDGALILDGTSTLSAPRSLTDHGPVCDALRSAVGLPLHPGGDDATIGLAVDDTRGAEAYELHIAPHSLSLVGGSPAGIFYGIQTLRQLLPADQIASPASPITLPALTITDEPTFGWRGAMVDVGRHFMPIQDLRGFVDILALHKLNILHLHLTDDQGWRFEVKKWPRLTEVGAWRDRTVVGHADRRPVAYDGKRHGGFYTQDEMRDLVAYAEQRFVRIVPEIDMPGHMQAARAAYPDLGYHGEPGTVWDSFGISEKVLRVDEPGLTFARDVLGELMDVFPSPFIHIGGDECPKADWEASAIARAQLKSLGLTDMNALQSWFTGQLGAFLRAHDRRLVGWDEILDGGNPPAGAVVMSWRGMEPGIRAIMAGTDVVMTPNVSTYFNYYQGSPEDEPLCFTKQLSLEQAYAFDPLPGALTAAQAAHVLGVQGQLWTEYIPDAHRLQYMAFPRLSALAEIGWTYRTKDFNDFHRRMGTHVQRLAVLGVTFRSL